MSALRPVGAAALPLSALVLALSAVVLTACAGAPDATPAPTTSSEPTTVAPEPSNTPDPEPASDAAPTCGTLISADVVADYESIGITSQEAPLYIAGQEVKGGIRCMWANYDQPAGDSGQIFGWAKITDAESESFQNELIDEGWTRESAPEGDYVTESPDTALVTDEQGYGMTYLFAEGAVTVADTKQGLLLIEWPKG